MKIEPGSVLETKFPLCARYVRNFLSNPNVFASKYQRVWNAFLDHCTKELSPAQGRAAGQKAREALTMDQGPAIAIMEDSPLLPKDNCAGFNPHFMAGMFGNTTGPFANTIMIQTFTAESYEFSTGWKVWEGALLHECVHWARFWAAGGGNDHFISTGEVGDLFELAAYGGRTCVAGPTGKPIPQGPSLLCWTILGCPQIRY
jgi:hypothetical protein